MPQVEFLAYSPLDMKKFDDFLVNGIRDGEGKFIKDDQDRLVTGVIAWLLGREIPRARFFSSPADDTVKVFVSVIEFTEDEIVPWMRRVPGFHEMVRQDGQIGLTPDLNALNGDMPLQSVKPRPDLDAIFEERRKKIDSIDFEKHNFTREKFLEALKGVRKTDVGPMLAEIKADSNVDVVEVRSEFRVKAATT